MTTLYFVRHGQKNFSFPDPGLTKVGFTQARETGQYLKQFPIAQIIVSPKRRTQETAQEIAQVLQLPITTETALLERMEPPADMSREDFLAEWHKATYDRNYQPKFGDSSAQTGQRMLALLRKLATTNQHIVLVSHGGAIADCLRSLFSDDKLRGIHKQMETGMEYKMLHCAITKVVLTHPPSLGLLNFTDHLTQVTEF